MGDGLCVLEGQMKHMLVGYAKKKRKRGQTRVWILSIVETRKNKIKSICSVSTDAKASPPLD